MNHSGAISTRKFFPGFVIFLFFGLVLVSLGTISVTHAAYRCEAQTSPNLGHVYTSENECQTYCSGGCASVVATVGGSTGGSTNFIPKYPTSQLPPAGNAPVTTADQALSVFVNLINFAQAVFWILAAGFGLYGAYLYLFSGGNKESVTQAKNMMVYTVVAVAVAIVSYGIPAIITNFVSISTH